MEFYDYSILKISQIFNKVNFRFGTDGKPEWQNFKRKRSNEYSKTSFREGREREYTESTCTQIPIKKMKSLKKTIQTCCFTCTEGQSSGGYKYQWQEVTDGDDKSFRDKDQMSTDDSTEYAPIPLKTWRVWRKTIQKLLFYRQDRVANATPSHRWQSHWQEVTDGKCQWQIFKRKRSHE